MATTDVETCFHCGLPVPAGSHWVVRIDGRVRLIDNGFVLPRPTI